MKDLLTYIITSITGSKAFSIEEELNQGSILLSVEADPDIVGLIIGKEGKTIKNIRKILSIRAALEDKLVSITVQQQEKKD